MQTPHASGSMHKNNENAVQKRGVFRGDLSSRIFERTFDNVAKLARDVPTKVKGAPLAVLGVGIGIGVGIASLMVPMFFTRRLSMYAMGKKAMKPYRKQLMKALGI